MSLRLAHLVFVAFCVVHVISAQEVADVTSRPDPREIVQKSVTHDDDNFKISRYYTYQKRVERNVNGKQETMTYDLLPIYGELYSKLIARNDHPLSDKEARKEDEKLEKFSHKLSRESDKEHQKRMEKQEEEQQRGREFVREVPDAYNFTLVGSDTVDGHDVWVIDCVPREGFQPKTKFARVLPKIKGRLYIDKKESVWVKVEAEFVDDITFGAFLIELKRGALVTLQATKINNEVWMPAEYDVAASARILFSHKQVQEKGTFSNFRKYTADAKIVGDPQEVPAPNPR